MAVNRYMGQLVGPFEKNVDIISIIGQEVNMANKWLVKIGIQTKIGNHVLINYDITDKDANNMKSLIEIGKTGIYEAGSILDENGNIVTANISSVIFPDGADKDTIVDYIISI